MGKQKTKNKDDVVITPTSDVFIAALWSAAKNEPLLLGFINSVLRDFGEPPITEATVLNPFNVKEFAVDKRLVLDVRVRDEARRMYNLEMQAISHDGFVDRTLQYWSDTYSSMLRVGDRYTRLVPVKSIIITCFPIFPELKNLHTIFEARARENPDVLLSKHFQMHFLRLGDMLKRQMAGLSDLDRGLQHWFNFFAFGDKLPEDKMSQLVDNDTLVQQAYQEFQRFTANEEMREKVRERQRFLETQQIYYDAAMDAGLSKGKDEKAADIARNMKNKGYGIDAISEMTGLSADEIGQLR
jgi:predicted transposase/invertase (TIGR01784 family)